MYTRLWHLSTLIIWLYSWNCCNQLWFDNSGLPGNIVVKTEGLAGDGYDVMVKSEPVDVADFTSGHNIQHVFNIQPGQDGQFYAEQSMQQQQLYADQQSNLQNLGGQGTGFPESRWN